MYHPSGPVRTLQVPPCTYPLECPPRANTARFKVIYCKVSQNGIVSPVFVNKACHSPHSQNGLRKSPLEILRNPFLAAFSHKELMVPFCAYVALYGQNDEVSIVCTPRVARERVVNTPRSSRSKLLLGRSSSLTQRGQSPDILNGSCFRGFTRPWVKNAVSGWH